jgi:sugar lactone lactonase YvrE
VAFVAACVDRDPPDAPLLNAGSESVITTVAGGRLAFSGDGGPADQANLNGPSAIAIDGRGVLVIADELNQRVRMVDATGKIWTIAGVGTSGSSGDGASASVAEVANPSGVAVDNSGTVYIADTGNNRVRAIDRAGRITTRIGDGTEGFSGDGDLGTSARLNAPGGLASDAAGNIYIADSQNHRIRKVSPANIVTTVAGSGVAGFSGDRGPAVLAQLNNPLGVAVDSTGNVYIADEGNNRIRRVDATGVITTIAGSGVAGFSGDGGQGALAALNHPQSVAVDRAGNVYIADTRNIRVRRIGGDGLILTVAGTGQRGFAGDGGPATQAQMRAPHGLAVDPGGNLFIADHGNNEIRKVDSRGIITRSAGSAPPVGSGEGGQATAAGLAHPRSVAADRKGNFYISDWNNNCVWKVTPQGIITTVAGTRAPGFSGDGGAGAAAQLTAPHGIAVDAAGVVYIADQNNSRVRRVGLDGVIRTIAGDGRAGADGDGGLATQAAVGAPSAVALDAAGNLYISQQASNVIRRVSPSGVITTIAGTGTAGFSGDGGPAVQAQLRFPIGIASDSAGNVYVAEQGNNRIRRVSVAGVMTTIAGNGAAGSSGDGGPAINAAIAGPFGVAVDPAGVVYLTDSRSNRIRRVAVDGVISTVAGNGLPGFSGDNGPAAQAQLQGPHGVAVDAMGNLLIADMANDRIRKVSIAARVP